VPIDLLFRLLIAKILIGIRVDSNNFQA
jgi:hypothetical protein